METEPGAGDVPIMLAGEDLVLKPTAECCFAVSKLAGNSLIAAVERCKRLDIEFICEVVALGLSATSPALKKEIRNKVFLEGAITVAAECILFIRVIMNGGKMPPELEEEGEDGERPLATPSSSESTTDG